MRQGPARWPEVFLTIYDNSTIRLIKALTCPAIMRYNGIVTSAAIDNTMITGQSL